MSRISIAVFAFVYLVAPFGSPAHAEATIVQNRDEPGRNVYQAHATFPSNCIPISCAATFPAIEPNRRVVAQFVSCYFQAPTGISPILVQLDGPAADPNERVYLPSTYQGTVLGAGFWVVSSPIVFYFSGGDKPTIEVAFSASVSYPGDCVLTGYHVLLP